MNKLHVLDCTLRDGGYCNEWRFGKQNIRKIIQSLTDAEIDVIECGFLTNRVDYHEDVTKFTDLHQVTEFLPAQRGRKKYVVMLNYGEYDVDKIPDRQEGMIDGIRVAFHKKDLKESMELCRRLKAKGYIVFVQAMVSLCYTDQEFMDLIGMVNEFEPYAFYIVDSFGMMKQKNLLRLFYMIEHNLKDNIWIGFHSHNNMQLAYSNAQALVEVQTNRNLVVDSSVYGMGRGAGNLNTELFIEYLNETIGTKYSLKPLLNVIDEILNHFYEKNYWGYSLPNYISAVHCAHPNYSTYWAEKNTLTVEAIDELFSLMPQDKRFEFDKEYAEKLYLQYMESGVQHTAHNDEFVKSVKDQTILLIAPGKSVEVEQEKIKEYVKAHPCVVMSVNFNYQHLDADYLFVSNNRRMKELADHQGKKLIVTSNIASEDVYMKVDYFSLLTPYEAVRDNAGMMAIQFLINSGAKEIVLAGFDGYSKDSSSNYVVEYMEHLMNSAKREAQNEAMRKLIAEHAKQVKIQFLTQTLLND
ncbi:MAG TPA: aldolase catalytic domain-containing protein [Candidatus Ruthenibacterium avium]|uniref:Aldolase catalytic domain-containing protein n=1 Tax=Candidatus Ruthenibacterium avium TaxID=2838751 RepID=A0A9D2M4W5_9FIRM|nr:aldolase catalytic domain-containing protein [Candidatus Ruthenibacterium avium]